MCRVYLPRLSLSHHEAALVAANETHSTTVAKVVMTYVYRSQTCTQTEEALRYWVRERGDILYTVVQYQQVCTRQSKAEV